jgi:hypothetical protein
VQTILAIALLTVGIMLLLKEQRNEPLTISHSDDFQAKSPMWSKNVLPPWGLYDLALLKIDSSKKGSIS